MFAWIQSIPEIFGDAFLDLLYSLGGTSGGARPKIMTKINDEDWIIKISSYMDGKMWKRWNTTILYVQKKWH